MIEVKKFQMQGVCPREVSLHVERGIIRGMSYTGGCKGNLVAVSKLVCGMSVNDAIEILSGIDCRAPGVSCASETARILSENYVEENKEI